MSKGKQVVAASFALLVATLALAVSSDRPAPKPMCPDGQVFWRPDDGCATLPVLRLRVEPEVISSDRGANSEYVVMALVKSSGLVEKANLVEVIPEQPAPDPRTSEAVVRAVRKWQFEPGRDTRGKPADMYLSMRIRLLFEE